MEIIQRIRESQGRIINNLMTCESLIAQLYEEFSRTDQDLSQFWHVIAKEENDHSQQLKTLLNLLDNGVLFNKIGRFDSAFISPVIDLLEKELESTRHTPPSRYHALSIALQVESTLIDSCFYDTVQADSPEYQEIASQLRVATLMHVDKIRSHFVAIEKPVLVWPSAAGKKTVNS
jgi:rubrerythrin